jgi:alpha-D-ribose 1-methylphosphonate 5-triphosphate synthase subunit PhnL
LALELIQELTLNGVAVLAVFHDLDAIEQVSHRIIAMEKGRIVQEGPTNTLLPLLRKGYINS